MQSANTRWHRSKRTWLLSSCQFVWGKVGCNSGRYAISWDHRRIVDAGRRYPQRVGVGAGKRRWYATIVSVERPRSRSTSTERRGKSLSRGDATPRSSSPCPPSCQPLVFTRATSVFTSAVPPLSHQHSALYRNTHSLIVVQHEFDRNASTRPVLAQSTVHSTIRQRP